MFDSSGIDDTAADDAVVDAYDNDAFEAQLPQIKLIAAAIFIIAARVYPKDRKGGGDGC